MRTFAFSTLIYLSSPDATAAFHPTKMSTPASGHHTQLDARRRDYSEIDSLRARRLGLRRPEPEPAQAIAEDEDFDYVVPLEYLYHESEIRDDNAPFHVLLLPSTFNDRRTRIEHVASSCAEVLGMPYDKAYELSMFAKYESFSVLGTWSRKECIDIGEKLREMEVECRLIPHEQRFDEWECPDLAPEFENDFDAAAEFNSEMSVFMEMRRSHDHDLESFMKKANAQQEDVLSA